MRRLCAAFGAVAVLACGSSLPIGTYRLIVGEPIAEPGTTRSWGTLVLTTADDFARQFERAFPPGSWLVLKNDIHAFDGNLSPNGCYVLSLPAGDLVQFVRWDPLTPSGRLDLRLIRGFHDDQFLSVEIRRSGFHGVLKNHTHNSYTVRPPSNYEASVTAERDPQPDLSHCLRAAGDISRSIDRAAGKRSKALEEILERQERAAQQDVAD